MSVELIVAFYWCRHASENSPWTFVPKFIKNGCRADFGKRQFAPICPATEVEQQPALPLQLLVHNCARPVAPTIVTSRSPQLRSISDCRGWVSDAPMPTKQRTNLAEVRKPQSQTPETTPTLHKLNKDKHQGGWPYPHTRKRSWQCS